MKTEMVRARVTEQEKAAYEHAAGREPLSSWVRRTLNDAADGVIPRAADPALSSIVVPEPRIISPAEAEPVRRCEQWRNHRAGRFCKTCGETMPV